MEDEFDIIETLDKSIKGINKSFLMIIILIVGLFIGYSFGTNHFCKFDEDKFEYYMEHLDEIPYNNHYHFIEENSTVRSVYEIYEYYKPISSNVFSFFISDLCIPEDKEWFEMNKQLLINYTEEN
jgi:hypothetical protein